MDTAADHSAPLLGQRKLLSEPKKNCVKEKQLGLFQLTDWVSLEFSIIIWLYDLSMIHDNWRYLNMCMLIHVWLDMCI